jgi:two-component system, chemotaxis family, protein-glutamate methylesterase/glutaminase
MTSRQFPIVALVCSAGGLKALTRVLTPLPATLPAAVVALQHMSPERPSELAAYLDQHTALRVSAALDGEPLAEGRALVAPPGQHMLITSDNLIALIASGAIPPARPSADLLLTTLALAAGPRAIAVVLTGHGTDGAVGAAAVHRFGGVVIASDEASSLHFAMPSATINRQAVTDHVVALDDVAGLLVRLTTSAAARGRAAPDRTEQV